MKENITGNNNMHTPAEPAVLNDPCQEVFDLRGRGTLGRAWLAVQNEQIWRVMSFAGAARRSLLLNRDVRGHELPRCLDGARRNAWCSGSAAGSWNKNRCPPSYPRSSAPRMRDAIAVLFRAGAIPS